MNIQEKINFSLLTEQNIKRERSGKWNPSSFGRCLRYQYWNRKDEPPTNPPNERTLRVFKSGKLFHDFVQGFVNPIDTEVKCETDDIYGRADIVTEDEVIDIKSMHSYGFHYMRKPNYDVNKEKFTNIIQVLTYAWILKKPKGRIVFVSKDDLCIAEYGFFTDKWKDKIQNELDILRWHWDNNELPPPKPRAYGGSEKKYCIYADKCPECKLPEKKKK